jgi:uncharacterized Tic20 family protein
MAKHIVVWLSNKSNRKAVAVKMFELLNHKISLPFSTLFALFNQSLFLICRSELCNSELQDTYISVILVLTSFFTGSVVSSGRQLGLVIAYAFCSIPCRCI